MATWPMSRSLVRYIPLVKCVWSYSTLCLATVAFDPVFFLHHANVDRLLALWQTINPDQWVPTEPSVKPDVSTSKSPDVSTSTSQTGGSPLTQGLVFSLSEPGSPISPSAVLGQPEYFLELGRSAQLCPHSQLLVSRIPWP